MKMSQFTFRDQITSFEDYMDTYLKNKSTDCILYCEDGSKFNVHKELFGQTDFMREIISSAKEKCCEIIEILCPCSREELKHLVEFLCTGEIRCEKKVGPLSQILDNLTKIFGFPENLKIDVKKKSPELDKVLITKDIITTGREENIIDCTNVDGVVNNIKARTSEEMDGTLP